MALLAYEEPEKSPLFQYLTDDYRQTVADELNSAVLGMLPVNYSKGLPEVVVKCFACLFA